MIRREEANFPLVILSNFLYTTIKEVIKVLLGRIKAKNQLTIPNELVRKLDLKQNDIVELSLEEDYIKITPVQVEPRYTPEELKTIDEIVEEEKKKGKGLKAGKEFEEYIRKI